MKWFRLYSEIINDPKIIKLDDNLRWYYIALLCVVSENKKRGYLPDDEDISIYLRINITKWEEIKKKFIKINLIIEKENKYYINGWEKRQYESDDITKRVQKHRSNVTETLQEKNSNVISSVSVSVSESVSESVSINKKKESKHKHGEFKNILLTDSEKEKLKTEYTDDYDEIIEFFSSAKEMKGYKYKSDYLAIKKWVIKAYFEERNKGSPNGFTKTGRPIPGKKPEFTGKVIL